MIETTANAMQNIIERSITLTTNILVERSALRGAYLSIIFLPILGYKRCNIPLLGAYINRFFGRCARKGPLGGAPTPLGLAFARAAAKKMSNFLN